MNFYPLTKTNLQNIAFNDSQNITNIINTSQSNFKANNKTMFMGLANDTFVRSNNIHDTYQKKLDALFPKGSLEKIYSQMAKELGIDILPKLKFYAVSDGVVAGGYTFSKNEISFSLEEFFANDHKVVMVKNGMYKLLTSPKDNMPLFIDKKNGEQFVNANRAQFKQIVDDLKLVPMTDSDTRKFIIHKIYHELIHAQQHMIMRSTEGIGEKEIIKAWTHLNPKSNNDIKRLEDLAERGYKDSFWANRSKTSQKYEKNSEIGQLAYKWLEAVRNYPPVDSPEYTTNAIEADAFKRSYEMLVKNFGCY